MNRSLILVAAVAGSLSSTAAVAADKVGVCHENRSGATLMLNIAAAAESAHLGHGDWSPETWYADTDGDGFGDPDVTAEACEQPAGFVADNTDLDDNDATVGDQVAEDEEFETCPDGSIFDGESCDSGEDPDEL